MLKHIFHRVYERESKSIDPSLALESRLRSNLFPVRPRAPLFVRFLTVGGMIALATILVLPRDGATPAPDEETPMSFGPRVDDWQYGNMETEDYLTGTAGLGAVQNRSYATSPSFALADSSFAGESLGFAVGGAKDANSFRLDIENGYLPLPTDLTYEGLFYDYSFDTGTPDGCDELFCPIAQAATSPDPISGEDDLYLSVGLASGMQASDIERKKLNLVIVLDNSGSMGSPFDTYYYDQGMPEPFEEDGWEQTKMQVANQAIVSLLGHLEDEDRFGMVIFNSDASVAKPLSYVGETDMDAIAEHVRGITPTGSTNMSAGIELATELLEDVAEANPDEYETRIIFLTDAMPNTGTTGEGDLLAMTEQNAEDGIHTTFIGIGVDFQTELVEAMTKVRGANYYAVHSPSEFETRMDDQFDFMVNPLVFDLSLELDADGYEIEQVYGSPEADQATGQMLYVNTLFPSETTDEGTRGGIILVKIKRTSGDAGLLRLTASYKDRSGRRHEVETIVETIKNDPETTGLRKAILLARYADLLKNWMTDERRIPELMHGDIPMPLVREEIGIIVPPPWPPEFGYWEQTSQPLTVSDHYEALFETFLEYLETETALLDDDSLEQEGEILRTLIEA